MIHDKITLTSDAEGIPLPNFNWPSHGRIITLSGVEVYHYQNLTEAKYQFNSIRFKILPTEVHNSDN
jgi:aspartate/tyrosine/aromatic aminotransferase